MLKRKVSPPTKALELKKIKEPEIIPLDNGIEVAFFNLGSQDLIHVELIFDNGLTQSSNIIIPTAVSELFGTASSSFGSGEIAEKLDFYGAFLETTINKDIASISIYSLTEHIDDVLNILFDALFNLVYPQNDIDIFLSNSLQKLKSELEKVEYVCLKTFNQYLFKDHLYGDVISFSDFENISSKQLQLYFKSFYNPEDVSVVVSGKFDNSSLYNSLNNHLGLWKGGSVKKNIPSIDKSEIFKLFVTKTNALQSAIRIGKIVPVKYGSVDYFKLKLLNTILGGYFGSRLMSNLREEKGLTYGINSSFINYDAASFVVISTTVKGESTSIAVKEIYSEIDRLSNQLVDNEELILVKNYISGSLMRTVDGPFLIAEQYKLLSHKGEKLAYLEKFNAVIQEITSDDLLQCAVKYFSVDSFSEVVVGPKSNN
jgi:zinc protease